MQVTPHAPAMRCRVLTQARHSQDHERWRYEAKKSLRYQPTRLLCDARIGEQMRALVLQKEQVSPYAGALRCPVLT
eukprot:3207837-Rhodomonas_salina.1